MAQQLRALIALAEDLGSVPNTYMVVRDCLELEFQGSNAIFWTPWALSHVYICIYIHIHTYTHTYTHIHSLLYMKLCEL